MAEVLLTEERPQPTLPCTEFGNSAVVVLEVVPRNAECVLDVTELVQNKRVYCFDDLVLASEGTHV
ncbi:HEPN/Toprim-associated domain-containing protein [Paraburkholderia phymatum]|uniref:Uncharacterized protein n=1 Tax=Paraburkholderia phymatum (strain DSM 17167 / CIP 108236 / LMG 21445 / STM815) TaxID=391038 RepID=B2JT79_PARP8|nr:HEPN/Toprim-associated domain-containing protein [Paraburkholderia phymatum]ACC75782.1 hypothetical protein Bphy_6761 [Paraburkholderia phymatum STM815]